MSIQTVIRYSAPHARTQPNISPEEYLAFELTTPIKHELVEGVIYAMTGSRDRHNLISGDIGVRLISHLPLRCQVFMTDMKLRVQIGTDTRFYYPDVMVSCSSTDREEYFREEPGLLVEVLSPSTERNDRQEKFEAYKQIASLEEYLLVSQDFTQVELFRRASGWTREVFKAGESFTLASVDLTFEVDDIYRRVRF